MQTLELKISQPLNVTYEEKRGRYEGERRRDGQTWNDREIKNCLWHNNCTYRVNIHILLTVNPKEITCHYSRSLFCIHIRMSECAAVAVLSRNSGLSFYALLKSLCICWFQGAVTSLCCSSKKKLNLYFPIYAPRGSVKFDVSTRIPCLAGAGVCFERLGQDRSGLRSPPLKQGAWAFFRQIPNPG